jgi:hypothetical protein
MNIFTAIPVSRDYEMPDAQSAECFHTPWRNEYTTVCELPPFLQITVRFTAALWWLRSKITSDRISLQFVGPESAALSFGFARRMWFVAARPWGNRCDCFGTEEGEKPSMQVA